MGTEDYDERPLYRFGIVERRCCKCPTAMYDYYRYTAEDRVGIWTAKEECCTCKLNVKIMAYGTEDVVGQAGDTKMFEIMQQSFAITCAPGTDHAAMVAFGIIIDDIREDAEKKHGSTS